MKNKLLILRTLNNFLDDLPLTIISDKYVIPDFIDWNNCLSLEEFSTNTKVQFQSEDFFLAADEDIIKKLKKGRVDLEEFSYIGWFSPEIHGRQWNQIKLMKPTDYNEIDSYKYLTRKPFIYFKENLRHNFLTNTLRGGLGLALHFKEDDYFNLINNISWIDNKWVIRKEDIKPNDFEIIHQLMLFQNLEKDPEIFKELLFSLDDENQRNYFIIYNQILLFSLKYFAEERFESRAYIKALYSHLKSFSSKMKNESLIVKFNDFIFELQKLLNSITEEESFEPQKEKRLIKIIMDFIQLSRIDTNKLTKDYIDQKNYLLVTFFILGMYQKYDRIKKVIESNKLEHYVISECAYRVSNLKFNDNSICIVFDEPVRKELWSTKFKFIYNEFEMIREIRLFSSQSERLKLEFRKIREDISQLEQQRDDEHTKFKNSKIRIERDIYELHELEKKLIDKKNALILSKAAVEKDQYIYWSSLSKLKDRVEFEKQIKTIKGDQFQKLCEDFEEATNHDLDKKVDGKTYLIRASAGKISNIDKIINHQFPKSTKVETNLEIDLDEIQYQDLSSSEKEFFEEKYEKGLIPTKDSVIRNLQKLRSDNSNSSQHEVFQTKSKQIERIVDGTPVIEEVPIENDD